MNWKLVGEVYLFNYFILISVNSINFRPFQLELKPNAQEFGN